MSIGSVVTRGFSTGTNFQPGIRFVPPRGFLTGVTVIAPPPSLPKSASASGAVYADGQIYRKHKRKQDEEFLLKFIDNFMRNIQ